MKTRRYRYTRLQAAATRTLRMAVWVGAFALQAHGDWSSVLTQMYSRGLITSEQYQSAIEQGVLGRSSALNTETNGGDPAFRFRSVERAGSGTRLSLEYTEPTYTGGVLNIFVCTNLDMRSWSKIGDTNLNLGTNQTEWIDTETNVSTRFYKAEYSLAPITVYTSDQTTNILKTILNPTQDVTLSMNPGIYKLPTNGLKLTGLRDVRVKAIGVTFLSTNPVSTALSLERCTNVSFEGMTIDYDPLPFTQGTITNVNTNTTSVGFTIHSGYPALNNTHLNSKKVHVFHATQHAYKVRTPALYQITNCSGELGSYSGRVDFQKSETVGFAALKVGDRMAIDVRHTSKQAVYIGEGCSNVCMTNVTIYSAPEIAVMIRLAESAGSFNRLRVIPGPKPPGATEERLLSSSADGFNVGYTRRGPTLDGCEFGYTGDDGINLHGVLLPVLEWEDNKTFFSMRPSSNPFERLLRPGDEVRFLLGSGYSLTNTAKIESISRGNPVNSTAFLSAAHINSIWPNLASSGPVFYRIVLDTSVSVHPLTNTTAQSLFVEVPVSAAPGYSIRNCFFHDNPGRGVRVMASNGQIEDNLFAWTKGSAIGIGGEFYDWREAGWVSNVTVCGNLIQEVLTGDSSFQNEIYTPGAISIFARVTPKTSNTVYGSGHHHISILSNWINGCSLDGINVVGAGPEVLIERNIITNVNTIPDLNVGSFYGLVSGQPIAVQRSESEKIQNNTLEKVAVNWTSNAPANRILTSYSTDTTSYDWSYTSPENAHKVGQSFYIASNSVMDSFSLKAGENISSNASGQAFTVKLFENSSSTNLGYRIQMSGGTYLNSRLTPIVNGWVTFDIPDLNLTASNYYTFILSWDTPATGRSQRFRSGTTYSGGRLWDGLYSQDPQDFVFSVQGATQP